MAYTGLKLQNSEDFNNEAASSFYRNNIDGITTSADALDNIQRKMPVANMSHGNTGPTGPASGPSF